MIHRVGKFLGELKRRKVFKVGSVYVVTAWALTLGAAELFPVFGAPDWTVRLFAAAAVLGLPIAIVLAWAFELTPQGVERDARDRPAVRTAAPGPSATTALFGRYGVVRVSWVDGTGKPQERAFDGSMVFGRDSGCAIRFDDPLVSRRHAEISFVDGRWQVADLGSRNGTWLDGARIERAPLPARSTVRLSEAGPTLVIELQVDSSTETRVANP